MNLSKHSQETIDRMKANSEAAKKRLARLNQEYLVRQKVRQPARSTAKPKGESFGEAVARLSRQHLATT